MKSPGVGITVFFVCPTVGNRPTSERQIVERNHFRGRSCTLCKEFLIAELCTIGIPMFTLTLSSYFLSPGESWLHSNVVINWQLSKQGIRWPVSPDRIAGSGVDPWRTSIFLKLSAVNLFIFKLSHPHVYFFFKIHIKYLVFMSVSRRTITILISNWPQTQKFSQFF